MFERFTDRARKVMALANQEAQRLNHEYIGTEHILLGLVKEGSGVGANVLRNLDVDLRKVRLEVEKLVRAGPEMVTMGKLPQTPRAKKVIEYAIEEARNLNHNYVGTEHLLLGLLREHDGVAAQVLMNLGLKLEEVREEVLNLLGAGNEQSESIEGGGGSAPSSPAKESSTPSSSGSTGSSGSGAQGKRGRSQTPALDSFGRDLTELARENTLDPVIGRTTEIERCYDTARAKIIAFDDFLYAVDCHRRFKWLIITYGICQVTKHFMSTTFLQIVTCDLASHIGGATIDLARIFAAKAPATNRYAWAVVVDNQFTPGQTGVSIESTLMPITRGVGMNDKAVATGSSCLTLSPDFNSRLQLIMWSVLKTCNQSSDLTIFECHLCLAVKRPALK